MKTGYIPTATALPVEIAVPYLREMHADLLAAVVFDFAADTAIGDDFLIEAAEELLRAVENAVSIAVLTRKGFVFSARSSGYAIVAVCSSSTLPSLVTFDIRSVLSDLEGDGPKAVDRDSFESLKWGSWRGGDCPKPDALETGIWVTNANGRSNYFASDDPSARAIRGAAETALFRVNTGKNGL